MAGFLQKSRAALLDSAGKPYPLERLQPSDVIALYFSASWCGPCQQFTPVLKQFYEALQREGDDSLKIIFVSSDRSEGDMWSYFRSHHGPWLTLAYGSEAHRSFPEDYGVRGIPALMVLDQAGEAVVMQGVQEVFQCMQMKSHAALMATWRAKSGAAPRLTRLSPGLAVTIVGLQSKPELNGTAASVKGFNAEKHRYDVVIGDSLMALKPANLVPATRVQLTSTDGTKEEATLAGSGEGTGEFIFKVGDREERRTFGGEGNEVRLKDGGYVVVQHLKAEAAQQWNECLALLVAFEEDKGRYLVEVANGKRLSVKPDNLRLCPLT